MIENEADLAKNIQTLRDTCGEFKQSDEACFKAMDEVMEFMKKEGPLQTQIRERDLITVDKNSISFPTTLYPGGSLSGGIEKK